MAALLDDLRYGLRALARNLGFTIVAVLSLAVGIGANTTVFTMVNAILLRQLPVAAPSRLAAVHIVDPRNPGLLLCSYPNYKDFRDQNQVFSSLLLYSAISMNLTGRGDPKLLMGHLVSGNYFSTLGVSPVLGRGFVPEEDAAASAAPAAVLSYGLWMREFGGNPAITSQTISLGGRAYNIVGIAPKGFRGLNQIYAADVWVPMAMAPSLFPYPSFLNQRRALLFAVVGRLEPGLGIPQAEAGMQAVAAELARQYPKENEGRRVKLTSIAEASLAAKTRAMVTNAGVVLLIISSLVLLIACGNVANLLLARGVGRAKEISVRLALGASRGRIVRQLLTESILLAVLGGVVGLAMAKGGRDALWAMRPPLFNYSGIELALDQRVLAYTLVATLVTGILFGLAPALGATRGNLANELKQRTGRTATAGGGQLRSFLVSSQVAFSIVALVGASLFVRSMRNAIRIDPGFDAAKLGIVAFNVGDQGYGEARGREYQQRALEIAASTPGVISAALAKDTPFHVSSARTVLLEGQDNTASGRGRTTLTSVIGPGYFRTMGISLLRGRDFRAADSSTSPRAAIVNQAAAAHFWPGEDAIGKRIQFAGDPAPVEVVGIARNANYQTIGEPPQALLYLSLFQYYFPTAVVYVRTAGDPEAVSAVVRKQMQALDRNLLLQSESLGKTIRESLWAQQLSGSLLAVFGGLALILSTMGIYGVIAYSVNQRIREFGVRMALGATAAQVQTMVLAAGMRMVAVGVVAGLLIALGAAQAVRSMLFVISPYDAVTFVMVPAILCLAGALACWVPALRAVRIDPAVALRDE